jgi:hypothetical protein
VAVNLHNIWRESLHDMCVLFGERKTLAEMSQLASLSEPARAIALNRFRILTFLTRGMYVFPINLCLRMRTLSRSSPILCSTLTATPCPSLISPSKRCSVPT